MLNYQISFEQEKAMSLLPKCIDRCLNFNCTNIEASNKRIQFLLCGKWIHQNHAKWLRNYLLITSGIYTPKTTKKKNQELNDCVNKDYIHTEEWIFSSRMTFC